MQYLKYIFVWLISVHSTTFSFSQTEVLMDLQTNPLVIKKHMEQVTLPSYKMAHQITSVLSLPFLDDFSKESVYPDTAWWEYSQSVFINRDYPRHPISLGVATFDGIDSTGYPYNFAATSSSSGLADRLTSKPINLGNPLTVADSVYLSFFYQAKGLGNAPEPIDSLILEFKSPTKNWTRKWAKAGYTPSSADTLFHRVMISVTDTAFFKSGFQFRFKNYATLSGNVDHWHVDYVYLNKARSKGDTIFEDVSFVYNGTAFLKIYQSMPWNQFTSSDKSGSTKLYIRNNDSTIKVTSYKYILQDRNQTTLHSYLGGNDNLKPFTPNGYSTNLAHITPPFTYVYSSFTDTISFITQHIINTVVDDNRNNDTLRFYQKFYDYYAYDDGTAEAAYGLSQIGSQLAYRFTMNNLDTLKAVQFYWNPVINNVSTKGFRITIWNDNSGVPGSIVFQDSVRYPVYDKKGYNYFHTYPLTYKIIPLSGIFYVGWTQVGPDVLNVGFDMNINHQNKIFYNTTGTWLGTLFPGALMIRPIFKCGKPFDVGIQDNNLYKPHYDIYPNPANDRLFINSQEKNIKLSIYDTYGRLLLYELVLNSNFIDISSLANGIYFVQIITDEQNTPVSQKIVVAK